MSNAETAYWGFVFLASLSLVGGWLIRRALVKADRDEEREKTLAQSRSLTTPKIHT